MKQIKACKKRNVCIDVDDVDFEEIKSSFTSIISISTRLNGAGKVYPYAIGKLKTPRDTKWMPIHRFVLERKIGRLLKKDELCDHINGNVLDNTRGNLRVASRSQNQYNKTKKYNAENHPVKGIFFEESRNKWRATITSNKKTLIKRFSDFEDAVTFLDKIRRELHGEFSRS